MSSRSRGSILTPLVLLLALCRGSVQIAKNFVNSSTPDFRPIFVVNFDTSTVICQHSSDPTDLHIHNMSSLCDGKQDCFVNPAMHDEVFPYCEHKCESTCSGKGACLYDGAKPQCYCDSGYSGSSCELQDKNECLEHPCHLMAQCQNTLGSYECRCLPGYQGNGHDCNDIDECSENLSSRCPEHSTCINLPGTYYCNCTQGFTPKGNQGSGLDKCVDINECETGAHNCEHDEICENTIGSFKCVNKCSPGYELIDGKCEDVNECFSEKLHKCDVRAECINTVGGYECECEEGFDGDGKNCQPKSSCRKNSAICDRHASCHIVLDICDCKTGYTGDGITCHDIDECDAKEKPCSEDRRCLNLDGGYVCCESGQDDGECIKEQGAFCSGGCGDNAICSNATCECIEGFRGDPHKKCVDINECVDNDQVCGGVGDRCVNLFGGFKCCQHGSSDPDCQDQSAFSSDSSTFSSHGADFTTTGEEVIEGSGGSIQTSSGGSITVTRGLIPKDVELTTSGRLACTSYCPPNSECVSGYCECVKGYGGNALVGCEDIDECITETCDLEANEWCVNLIGGFVCCNPTNATHDDCIGLEITKEKGLHIIGGNEEDTVVATRSNHSTSDQLITQVVQQSRNFSSGQIILTRGKVGSGEALLQSRENDGELGLEISAGSGNFGGSSSAESGGTGKSSASWTEDGDEEGDEDLMEASGSWTTNLNGSGGSGFTGAPDGGTIRVRITTLGEDGEVETATKAGVQMPKTTSVEGSGESSGGSGSSTSSGVPGKESEGTTSSGKPSEGSGKPTTTVEGSGSSESGKSGSGSSSEGSTSSGEGSGGSGSSTSSGEPSGTSETSGSGTTSSGEGSVVSEGSTSSGSSGTSESGSSGKIVTSSEGSTSSGKPSQGSEAPSGSSGSGTSSEASGKPAEGSGQSRQPSGGSTSSEKSSEGSGAPSGSSEASGKPSEGSGASSGASTSSGDSGEPNLAVKKEGEESTSSGVHESSGDSLTTPSPESSGEWVETGSKGHFESGSKIIVGGGSSEAKPTSSEAKPTSSGEKPTSSGEKPTSSEAKPTSSTPKIETDDENSTSETKNGILTTNSGGKNATFERGTKLEKVNPEAKEEDNKSGENPGVGLEISAGGPKDKNPESNEVGLEIIWESTTPSTTTPDSDNVGLEISGSEFTKKPQVEGSGTGDDEITATTRDVSKSTKKPRVEIDGGDNEEVSGVDGKITSTTPKSTSSEATKPSEESATSKATTKPSETSSKQSESSTTSPEASTPSETSATSSKPSESSTTSPDSSETTTTSSKPSETSEASSTSSETSSTSPKTPESSEATPKPSETSSTAPDSSESTTASSKPSETPEAVSTSSETSTPSETSSPSPKPAESSTTSPEASTTSAPEPSVSSTPPSISEVTPDAGSGESGIPDVPEGSGESTTTTSATSTEGSGEPQPATIAPVQTREEKPEPTKDTFALPTTTTAAPNATENAKCTSSDECGMDALCERRTGVCRCEPGFEGAPPKKLCVDVDECATGDHKCHETARCQNYIGGYACFCPTGFRKTDDGSCEDIDECTEHNSTCCGSNAKCVNKPGTYTCECESGFIGDGYKCVANTKKPCDSVQTLKAHCSESNMSCEVDTVSGDVECKECMSGYKKTNGGKCEDVNECDMDSPCSPDASCVNLNGTFSCSCKDGFRGDGFMCSDINECDERHPCHPHAECTNLPGKFTCQCHAGFEGDGVKKCTNPLERSCEDVEKFCGRVDHVSCLSVRIFNGSLSSVCECEPGFRFDKKINECVDIDECEENRNNCDPASAVCVNTEGSFKCECAEGYEGEGGICTDIDECDRGMAGCDSMAMCINRMGSCECKCMPGYTGDGAQCTKIEEPTNAPKPSCTEEWSRLCELEKKQCTVDEEEVPQCGACLPGHHPINGTCQSLQITGLCAEKNDCNKHAVCIDIQPDSHFCSCPDGFIGDGMICDDVDECNNAGMCDDENSKCVNTIGSYNCICLEGFKKDNEKCVVDEKKQPNRGKIEIDEETTTSSETSESVKPSSEATTKSTSSESPATSTTAPTTSAAATKSATSSPTPPPSEGTTPLAAVTKASLCSTVTCHSLATCEPSTGVCICRDGFIGDGSTVCSKKSSADCVSLPSLCADNAKCDNSTRSCECDAGYIGDGYVCSPHPQDCVLRENLCSPEAICQNRRCQCLPGFTGDGVKCVSIHERASNCSQCDANAHCVGGTTCKCNNGYFGNGLCCVPDPLDCVHFTGICHPNAVCNPDSRQCQCSSGFSGNGVSCFPQKSCRTDKSVCAKNAICLPTGSCICRHGFKGDPFYKCTSIVAKEPTNAIDLSDVSSCATPCDSSTQLCISGECICKPGFRNNSTLSGSEFCADIDECAEKTDNCDRVAKCQNTFGSHTCSCPEGHVGDGVTCVPHVNQGKLSVYCEADGMTLVLGNETSDFEGKIFVKGQAENPYCSKSFSSLLNSHKPYVFKVAFQHCDVQLLDNHTMASTVVVQKHAMFLTNKADSYDLRCQYPIGSRAVESHVNVSELATTSTLTDKNSTLAPICRLSVSNDQHSSISSAMVGDTLKLALEVTPSDNFGILPRNCFAVNIESGERYTLTDDSGCAIDESLFPQWSVASTSKVQAVFRTFKWPDSSMIRFQCDCSPCVGPCSTPSCISSARFRRHHTTSPILNDEVRQELVLMSGVESLAVSSIINVHDISNAIDDTDDVVTSSASSTCVKFGTVAVAIGSFAVCSAILLFLCSKKPKTVEAV